MDKDNVEEFATLMRSMIIVYEKELTLEAINIYFNVLKEYKIEDVKKACDRHLKTSKYFPRPSELAILIQPSLLHQKNEFGY